MLLANHLSLSDRVQSRKVIIYDVLTSVLNHGQALVFMHSSLVIMTLQQRSY